LKVRKRDNSLEDLDITKIRKQTQDATADLAGVSFEELEMDASLRLVDGVRTSDIQQALIQTAVDKIDIDVPNWTYVAARLTLYDLYHRVNCYTGYSTLEEYFETAEDSVKFDSSIADSYDLHELDKYIKPERDMQFTYLGVKTMIDRYLLKDKDGEPVELPQHAFMAIAMHLASEEAPEERQAWAIKFYDMLSKFEVMMATPTLSNARTIHSQMSSCFIGSTPDDLNGIFDGFKEQANLSKYGGGLGWDWTRVRALGSTIAGHKDAAAGIIPAMKMENDLAIWIDQLGTRKGAIATYIEPWHMDVSDFLDLKKNSGEERRRAHDIFPALWINDLFIQRVKNDADWTLFDPYETPDLAESWGFDFEDKYLAYEQDASIRKQTVKAKDLWRKILTSYFESGSPFLCFKDTANGAHMNKHAGIIRSSNLCVAPETLVLTDEGYKPIVELNNKEVNVWNGDEFSATTVFKTGTEQELISVKTSSGQTLDCTPYHKFYTQNKYGGKIKEVEAQNLSIGDKLINFDLPVISGDKHITQPWLSGFYTAGGATLPNGEHKLYFYGGKRELLDSLKECEVAPAVSIRSTSYRDEAIYEDLLDKFYVPKGGYSLDDKLEWLAGLLDGAGCVLTEGTYNSQTLQLVSTNSKFIRDLQLFLQEIGVHSKISPFKSEGYELLPRNDGSGECKEYYCNSSERIIIAENGVQYLLNLGVKFRRLKVVKKKIQRDARRFITVTEIEATGRLDDTYCFTEPKRHMGMFNGILTGQCTEIFQFTDEDHIAVCNLASVNLSKINSKEDIERIVPIAIRALDNVIDLNFYPVEKAEKTNKATRAIGLGVMGEAQMVAEKSIYFASDEHKTLINEVMGNIRRTAESASQELAEERGVYPLWAGSEWDNRGMKMRNGYLMAIAPTSSISILVGTTQAIEPVYKRKWFEENLGGLIPVTAPNLSPETWQYYTPAYDIDQVKLVELAGIRQRWVDQGQSLNIFIVPENADGKLLNEIYMTAWEVGCKSTYYLRSRSPEEVVEEMRQGLKNIV